ncbi:TIGR01457 family HAD-type hydrolase [Planococcus sp. N028]|uniref:TIGR01457 family HAD-type hydrolase n=1 Tax=Planococcus shixiaomingii TaxID=3058393 RepID=A0ABT8N788_9BACL|nr:MULTISPECIES: TIGR01457 family HAD-type hydrolase [unclassified Planococcus (in: firmicutes)]MDN7243593.1 TIGR01457 family HAD-type hydrolase [Planococcus sp. N028]WKA56028.1 TIGR01457 family HAD-type hydrolase [Planococcus sp. N022]
MKNYKAYCLDLDGTVYRGTEVIPEAVTFIERLQKKGIEPFFVTNNASMTQQQLGDKLARFGVKAEKSRIISSAVAAAKYIKHWYPGKKVFMIGSAGLEKALLQEGIERVKENGDIVLMGIDRDINFDKLAEACLEVRKGAIFISTNGDLAYPSEKGLIPGNGAYTTLVAASTGVDPLYIGKPEMHMLEAIMLDFGFDKKDMVMIGDNYDTDIKAGIHFGIDTIHVNTGVTSTEEAMKKAIKPTCMVESLEMYKV